MSIVLQPLGLQHGLQLSLRSFENKETLTEKALSLIITELFFYQVYHHFCFSPLITPATAKIFYGLLAALPIATAITEWPILSEGLKWSVEQLFLVVKIHALCCLILKQELTPLVVFVPLLVDRLIKWRLPHPKTERMVEWLLEAIYTICLFYPLSSLPLFYYAKEAIEIAFYNKQVGDYTSYLLENYLSALEECQGEHLDWTDTVTPAYLAVLKEAQRLVDDQEHPDIDKYPKRREKLLALANEVEKLSPQELASLKENILQNNRRSPIAQQIYALTGYYTGTAGDLLDEKTFQPHQTIQSDPRVAALTP